MQHPDSQQDIDTRTIEVTIEQLEEAIAMQDALEQLEQNVFYKKVIAEGYLKDNAVRLVHLKGASAMSDKSHQEGIIKQLDGIGSLSEHLRAIVNMGNIARKRLDEYSQELSQEELEDALEVTGEEG